MTTYTSQTWVKALGLIVLSGLNSLSFAQSNLPLTWSQAGPVYNAGRSRNLVVDKADASNKTLYTGSASSGIYRTTDGGANWRPYNNASNILNISYMAQAGDNLIYAATGEGFLRSGQKIKAQPGTGLYRLNMQDSSLTQILPASQTGTVINRIACSPLDPNIIALATNKGILIYNTNGGLAAANGVTLSALTTGQDLKFDNNGILYCSVGSELNNTEDTRVYKSTDNALGTFTDITPTSNVLANTKNGRTELAIAPSNNNIIYASVANKATDPVGTSSSLKGLFVSYDAGATWGLILQGSAQLDPLTNGANISSGDYSQVLVVSPGDANQLLVGGYSFYTFIRTGGTNMSPIGTWTTVGSPYALNTPFYLHENIHDIKIIGSGATTKIYFVTDAGIFRSGDIATASALIPPSFQPFYKGLVTGQFNSVSIGSLPTVPNQETAAPGDALDPNDEFVGGTGGNGLTYFSGKYPQALQETNYLAGEVYNAEYSKLLPAVVFASAGKDNDGNVYRSSDIRISPPTLLVINSYTGTLAQITPLSSAFLNNANGPNGTIFKLWENYGQVAAAPDSLVFYNDSIRVQTSIAGVPSLTTQTTFTFSIGRPTRFALIDSIAIRTGTVVYDVNGQKLPTPFQGTDKKDIFIKLPNNYTTPTATTTPTLASMIGPASAAGVTLNATSGLDDISVTFSSAPFANKTTAGYPSISVPDASVFYKVFATIFYKYKAGDTINITDNSISTRAMTYTFTLQQPLRWSYSGINGPKPVPSPSNPLQKIATKMSARLAMIYSGGGTANLTSIVVSKAPLNLNDPMSLVRISQSGALTTDATGAPVNSVITIPGKPTLLEWSKSGTELFYATDDNKLYRVSNIFTIMDNSPSSYSGKLSTDIFKYNSAVPSNPANSTVINPNSPYRTTLLGTFTKPITSISVSKSDSALALTFNDPTGTLVMYSANNIKKSDYTNINFTSRNGTGLNNLMTYCSMMTKDDNNTMLIGTDRGIFYTSNLNSPTPTWDSVNTNLPKLQVLDIKQQVLAPWQCYNSGQIYAATNGRGVWTNKKYFTPNIVSVQEIASAKTGSNLRVYPNPTNGSAYISFSTVKESAVLQVMDINGRIVKQEPLGKLYAGEVTYQIDMNDLNAGIYIVNVSSDSGIKRVAKLILTK